MATLLVVTIWHNTVLEPEGLTALGRHQMPDSENTQPRFSIDAYI